MCGIVGLLGNVSHKLLLDSLKQLQNRGYDSAGICTINADINSHFGSSPEPLRSVEKGERGYSLAEATEYNQKTADHFATIRFPPNSVALAKEFDIIKYASDKDNTAIQKLEQNIVDNAKDNNTNIINGIGHTRWATHGPKTDLNSHPHMCMNQKFCLVHNGIIENYKTLKNMLVKNGYTFKSQTDTEVIVNLLSFEYNMIMESIESIDIQSPKQNVLKALKNTIEKIEGTWGLVIMCIDTPQVLYCTRHGSPLLISVNDHFAMVVSEQNGFCGKVENYFVLNNHDICVLEKENNKITISSNEKYDTKKLNSITTDLFCHPYPHWTLKEIHEQGDSTLRAISLGGRLLSNEQVKLGGLEESKDILINIDNLIILGCGTSYYAGMIGSHYFKDLCNFNIVHVFDGAEFSEQDIPKYGKTALLLLSQSGETKDLHRCIDIGKKHNLFLIGLINVVDSMIAREVDCGCYLNAGREVAVASTKSFTSQVILLSLMSIWFAQSKNMNSEKRKKYITDLRLLHFDINKTICICDDISHDILDIFEPNTSNSCFILGKGKSEAIAKEGALKIKELTYIHAEGYSTSSLKHGPFALLHNGFPVIMISPNNEYYVKNNNAYEEILSRHAKIIFITDYQECDKINSIILPENKSYADLLCVIPLQMLAYKLSIKRGINPDMPQNLAKVVTVE